ncbi:MAG TPA: magnesium transporter, partial [Methanocorpusculum sp.]|nr:magnesium transporter [Methanocorpusculum sp.]
IVTAVGVGISVICYRRRWDLDMIGAPTVTTIGDMVTLPTLVVSALVVKWLTEDITLGKFILLILLGAIVLVMIVIALISFKHGTCTMKNILKEGLPLLIPLSLLGIFAGLLYTNRLDLLISAAAVLILTSPFMNGCGSLGGILTSRIGTEMHMGLIDSKIIPQKLVWDHFLENYVYALFILPLMAVMAHYAAKLFDITTPGLVPMLLITLLAGVIVITIMNILGYLTAVITYRVGFDPDNFGVPVVTSSIDLIGSSILLLIIEFFKCAKLW